METTDTIPMSETIEEVVIPVKKTRKSKEELFRNATIKRFEKAPWIAKQLVTIGGLGGIGSNVAYILAKWGYDMIIFEDDVVEALNIGGQMYFLDNIGKTKVNSMSQTIYRINKSCKIYPKGRLDNNTSPVYAYPITLACFDSIEARRDLFNLWIKNNKNSQKAIFIDGRMYSEGLEIFAVTPDNIDRYKETLFEDKIEELPCNYKATTQTGLIIAGLMTGILSNFVTETITPLNIREIPFRTEFVIPGMYYETIR